MSCFENCSTHLPKHAHSVLLQENGAEGNVCLSPDERTSLHFNVAKLSLENFVLLYRWEFPSKNVTDFYSDHKQKNSLIFGRYVPAHVSNDGQMMCRGG